MILMVADWRLSKLSKNERVKRANLVEYSRKLIKNKFEEEGGEQTNRREESSASCNN